MNTARLTCIFAAAFFCLSGLQAQTSSPSDRAIIFADSFLKSYTNNDIDQYTDLSYPGVISYYGGNKNFREYVQRARTLNKSGVLENITLVQIIHDITGLQCVIEKISATTVDGRKAQIISYMIGQSHDEGESWKFVDIAQTSPANLVYIMPDISEKLSIPQRQIIF